MMPKGRLHAHAIKGSLSECDELKSGFPMRIIVKIGAPHCTASMREGAWKRSHTCSNQGKCDAISTTPNHNGSNPNCQTAIPALSACKKRNAWSGQTAIAAAKASQRVVRLIPFTGQSDGDHRDHDVY